MYYEIDENLAKRSKEMSSYDDYQIGSATQQYKNVVDDILAYAEEQKGKVKNQEAIKKIDNLVGRFTKQYADWINKYNKINCYCPSILITGGSNFSTKKKERQNAMWGEHFKRYDELMTIKDKIHSIVVGSYIIKSSDQNAIEELEKKIAKREELQKEMKEQNAYFRKYKTMKGYKNLSDSEASSIDEEIKSNSLYCNAPNPSYSLSNNNQEIRRLKNRLEGLRKIKAMPSREQENKYFKIIENTELMRLQLLFEYKPKESIREILKNNGFKWSPKNGCWQRQLNNNSKFALKRVLNMIEEFENNKFSKAKETFIKEWYIKEYPTDELGQNLKDNVSFYDLIKTLENCEDVYKFVGESDSIIRERLFEKLSEILECDYDEIYYQWSSENKKSINIMKE